LFFFFSYVGSSVFISSLFLCSFLPMSPSYFPSCIPVLHHCLPLFSWHLHEPQKLFAKIIETSTCFHPKLISLARLCSLFSSHFFLIVPSWIVILCLLSINSVDWAYVNILMISCWCLGLQVVNVSRDDVEANTSSYHCK
jgi:hypothetical protein